MSPSLRELFGLGSAPRLPAEVRSALSGERALAAAQTDDGTTLVGTRDRLHAVSADDHTSWPWEQVLRADWDDETDRLEVVPVGEYGRPVERQAFVLDDAADLLTLIRERVSASVVVQRRVTLAKRRGFTVFARRAPRGGPISWAFELDRGVDPDDPAVRAELDRALAEAQESLGVSDG